MIETIPAKTIVTVNKSREWFGTDYTMNLYRGCSHGCIYCDSRSSCYGIEDFDRVRVKENALTLVRNGLSSKRATGVVAMGSMSDPYNPFEKEMEYTRKALELISAYGFGAMITTKSPMITRDIDVLKRIQVHSPVLCALTITTCSPSLAKKLEPNAPPPAQRLEALRRLSQEGIFAGVLLMPVVPYVEDSEENIREVVYSAALAGARFVYPMLGMTLRDGQREYFYQKLSELFPKEQLPAAYQKKYGPRYKCFVPGVHKLTQAFREEAEQRGLMTEMDEIVKAYQRTYDFGQLSFFEA